MEIHDQSAMRFGVGVLFLAMVFVLHTGCDSQPATNAAIADSGATDTATEDASVSSTDAATDPDDASAADPDSGFIELDAGSMSDWYRPTVTTTWQWQIVGDVNTTYDVDVYDVDLFDVPIGTIEALHAAGVHVICYFSAGSAEDFRDDYDRFAPEDLGETLDGYPDERWVDIRSEAVLEIMLDRLDLAVEKGCDGVEPDNVTAYDDDSGFDLTAGDQLTYNRRLADESHARGLSVGLKNDDDQAEALVDYFDFSVNEQCHEYEECDEFQAFIESGKPIFNAEYPGSESEALAAREEICAQAMVHHTRTLLLSEHLDDSYRISCDD